MAPSSYCNVAIASWHQVHPQGLDMIFVVVPAYNEEENIDLLYRRVTDAAALWGQPFELVVVDDGSRDGTLRRLQEFAANDGRMKILSFSRNFGHQAAVTAGLHYAAGGIVAVIDADLQDPPEGTGRVHRRDRRRL